MKKFSELSEPEILALAISLEEEDERVYADFAEALRESFPATTAVFDGMIWPIPSAWRPRSSILTFSVVARSCTSFMAATTRRTTSAPSLALSLAVSVP